MPQKVLRFSGINRKINEFQGNGACEELINLRPTASGLEIIKPKKRKLTNVPYDVYTHSFGDKSLLIGVSAGNPFQIKLIADDGGISNIGSFVGEGTDYSIAFLGNQLLISNGSSMYVYAYKDGKYVQTDASVPDDLDIQYAVSTGSGYTADVALTNTDPKSEEFKEEVHKNWSAAIGQHTSKNETFGAVLVAFNISLADGTEFWTNKWIHINPFHYMPNADGKKMIYYEKDGNKRFTFNSYDINFTISLKKMSSSSVDNLVSKVNVYATRPVFPYNLDTMVSIVDSTHDKAIHAYASNLEESGVTKQLLYFQKSIPISKIENGDVSFKLEFSDTQAGEKVLEIDNGTIKRSGKIASYNNRAHIFDSYSTIYPQSVVCSSSTGYPFQTQEAYVHIECNERTVILKTKALVPSLSGAGNKIAVFYPDARAKKILIATDSSNTAYCTVNLEESSRYNLAFGEAEYVASYDTEDKKTTSNILHEANTINVSAQYNPFVFPVEYSYAVGGIIRDLATSYLPISSTQVGQYPLNVFTTNGVYAIEQGNGTSLYSNIVPLQPLVIDGKSVATPVGTFFISSRSLYLLSGREAVNLSYVLNGERELTLRDTEAYKRLCLDKTGTFHDYSHLISNEDFEDFVDDAVLTYDQLNNELIISSGNPSVSYSYVLNLDTKAYHKIGRRYIGSQSVARYAIEAQGSSRNLVDMHIEENSVQPILLQSRPMPLDALFSHIQRLVLLADARLRDGQKLCLSVFGSDNLHDWKCIISSQKHNTVLRQIRTNKAAKSYRDYIFLISGTVDTNTDLSDLIADYTVVARRLG